MALFAIAATDTARSRETNSVVPRSWLGNSGIVGDGEGIVLGDEVCEAVGDGVGVGVGAGVPKAYNAFLAFT